MAKHRTGHLFKRGDTFYVSWRVNGKAFAKALRDENGQSISDRRKAEQARVKFMAPFIAADETSALQSIAARLQGQKAELTEAENQTNPPLQLTNAWLEYLRATNRPDSGDATLRQYGFQFAMFVAWVTENRPAVQTLQQVTSQIADDYAAHLLAEGLSAGTHNKHINLLALVFRVLKDKARVVENPWTEIQRKRSAPQSRRELTVEELRKTCNAATGELRTLLALGIYTGLRLGDCATLRWAEVDLIRNLIRRVPNKTARSRPDKLVHIPIHPALSQILAEIPTESRKEYVLPETAARYLDRIDLVTDLVQRHFITCGIRPHKPGTGKDGKRAVIEVGFHSLRHSFVSLCRESNAPLSVVESIVGHSNPAMTRIYSHTSDLAAGKAVAALPSILGEAQTTVAKPNILALAKAVAESINAENWFGKREELIRLLSESPRL